MDVNWKLTDGINFASLYPLEARVIVVIVVFEARKGRPDGAVLEKNDKLGSKHFWEYGGGNVYRDSEKNDE